MKNANPTILIFLLTALIFGCVTPSQQPQQVAEPTEQEILLQGYLSKGQTLEQDGELLEAKRQYDLALSVDSKNKTALEGKTRVKNSLESLAEKYYKKGLTYRRKGRYDLAKQSFLKTLSYNPDHSGAKEMLAPTKKEKKTQFIVHTIKSGDSISKLAQKYYGDYKKYGIIAKFNNMDDATRVKIGQKIRIPEIGGVSFGTNEEKVTEDTADYVVHILKSGESVSKLAKLYYGDYKKFHIIAEFNNMSDATRVKIGQKIKIVSSDPV